MIDIIAACADLAREIIAEATRDTTIEGWCGIASFVLIHLYREAGLEAELAAGFFVPAPFADKIPHFWVMVTAAGYSPEDWIDHASFVDVTATQFEGVAEPVLRLDPGNTDRDRRYDVRAVDTNLFEEAFDEGEYELANGLTLIALAAARKRGIL